MGVEEGRLHDASGRPAARKGRGSAAGRTAARRALACALLAATLPLLAACGAERGGGERTQLDPRGNAYSGAAPDTFQVLFETSRGPFTVQVVREWAPLGADRFHHLVRTGFYDGVRFYRAVEGFMVQFGLHGDPEVTTAWEAAPIPDDSVRQSNLRGRLTFATAGPDTRVSELFINLADNPRLDPMGFAPLGEVVEGMEVVDALHTGYGEGFPWGSGPDWERVRAEGNAYLERDFPLLDHVVSARVIERE